jgi:uncharacterized protein (TIGR02246 family)
MSFARWCAIAALGLSTIATAASPAVSEIVVRTQNYSDLLVKMDAEALAMFYAADAQVAVSGSKPIQGRDAIKAHLQTFAGYQVLSDVMTAENIAVKGGAASVDGTYTQQVVGPKGKQFTARGKYKADWVKGQDGQWRIKSMLATPED